MGKAVRYGSVEISEKRRTAGVRQDKPFVFCISGITLRRGSSVF